MNILAEYLLKSQSNIESVLDSLHVILNSAKKGAMGLTSEESKTPEWKEAKRKYSIYWKMYQDVNQKLSKIRKPIGFEVINGKRVTIYKYL